MELQGENILSIGRALTPVTNTILNGVITGSLTASVSVKNFTNHAFQYVTTTTGNTTASIQVQSSLDNATWAQDYSLTHNATTASLFYLVGPRSFVRALFTITGSVANATASLFNVSAN